MSHAMRVNGTFRPNFLEGDVGLVLKTFPFPSAAELAEEGAKVSTVGPIMDVDTDEYGNKIIRSGTVYRYERIAAGIVYNDVDVTHGPCEGSVLVAGRVLEDRLSLNPGDDKSLESIGIVLVGAAQVTRGFRVYYAKEASNGAKEAQESAETITGEVPVDLTEYQPGSYAPVSKEHPLTKTGSVQLGWGLDGTTALTSIKMDSDKILVPVWLTTTSETT